jgi:hypothetical protein
LSWLITLVGAVMVALTLRDVFLTLFRPAGKRLASRKVVSSVWWLLWTLAERRPGTIELAGPSALLATLVAWVGLIAAGWTLVYWPHMPEDFTFSRSPTERGTLFDAFYLSLATLTTLGPGDIVPESAWLRVALPLEALCGLFVLVTGVYCMASVYSAVSRLRTLSHTIFVLRQSELRTGKAVTELDPEVAERILGELTAQLVRARVDLVQCPIAYRFATTDERYALPKLVPYLMWVAEEGFGGDRSPELRLACARLLRTIDDLAAVVARDFLPDEADSTIEILEGYARDHRHRFDPEAR